MLHNWLHNVFVVFLLFVVVTFHAHASDTEATFGGRLYGNHATVYFHPRDEMQASRVLEIFEMAKQVVAERLPNSSNNVKVFLYGSSEEMARGLATVLGYSPMEIRAVIKTGMSEQTNNTLHIHPKTAHWGGFLTHAIVDEHVHGVLREKYGTASSISATWIEEGLTSYLANEVLTDRLIDFESAFKKRRFKVAFYALVSGELPKLDEISTRKQWYNNINESNETWDNQYALAYFSVSYIVSHYGLDAVLDILSDVGKGKAYKVSLEEVTGTTHEDLEQAIRVSLLYTGLCQLYLQIHGFPVCQPD